MIDNLFQRHEIRFLIRPISCFFVSFLVLIMISFCGIAKAEQRGSCGSNLTWSLDDLGVLTISGTGRMIDYTYVTSSITPTPPWYSYRDTIKKVIIQTGVTGIGSFAFYDSANLASILIPDTVVNFGTFAFCECHNLHDVYIENVEQWMNAIFPNSESNPCRYLANLYIDDELITHITIPGYFFSINDYTFFGCQSLSSVSLPNSITSIGASAFSECVGLTEINIPNSVTYIGGGAFSYCSSLTNIIIPEKVLSLDYPFSSCSSLNNIIVDEHNPNYSSVDGVLYNKDITELICCPPGKHNIVIPDSVTTICSNSFVYCINLKSIELPDNVTTIGDSAFIYCTGLRTITIPNTVSTIGVDVFGECYNLTNVTLPDNLISIKHHMFCNCPKLTSIILPETITTIERYAFNGCENLSSITIPEKVASIDEHAFTECPKLKKVVFLGDITSFSSLSFSGRPTFYCYEFSDAEQYGKSHYYPIIHLDDFNPANERDVSFDADEILLAVGGIYPISIKLFPDYDKPEVVLIISDPTIVSLSNGNLTGLQPGQSTITAIVDNASATLVVNVVIPAENFSISPLEEWIVATETLQLQTIAEPEGTTAIVDWISSDSSIATVDKNGLVTTIKPGDVIIKAISDSGIIRETIIHACYRVTGISFSSEEYSIPLGLTNQLNALVTTRYSTYINHLVFFLSSDESIVKVDSKTGMLTAISKGSATITASSTNGITATCFISVRDVNILNLPDSLTNIESEAFVNIPAIDAIRIPSGITLIDADAFDAGMTLYVPHNSPWVQWAKENGYIPIEE